MDRALELGVFHLLGFWLTGMSERAERIGAQLARESTDKEQR